MNAQQLRNSILQEAIEGRLVPQDPNDEPASVLLERIREEKKRLVKEGKLKKSALKEIPFSEEGRPFRIPDSWEWCKLGWVGDWGAGATPAKGNSEYYDNGTIPWLRTGELNNGFVYDSEIKVTTKALEKCSLRMCEIGDVLIAMYGATIGKVAIAGIQLTTNQACCACTPHIVYNKYLMYYLMASKKTFIEMGEGGAQPNISREKIVDFPFPLPPLAEQKRIVTKIEKLLPKVEEYGKAQEALDKLNKELPERLKKSILQEAISGRLVPQDPNDEPASVLLERIREEKKRLVKEGKLKKKDLIEPPITDDEKPFDIPQTWEWVRLGEISTYANTKKKVNAANADLNLWGLDLEDIEKGGRLLCLKSVGERKAIGDKTCFSEGDILYSKLRPYLLKILIAPKDGICTPEIIPFTCYGSICKDYIVSLLKSAYVDDYINSVTFGVKMPRVSTETMISLVLPLPPLAEQKRIVAKIEELFAEIDKLKA